MAEFYDQISTQQKAFIEKQQMFFVATAPLSPDGRVNLSPKGLNTFRVLDANTVAYLDMTGSGNETSAHILENRRMTFMFCAFEGPPNILRLYGQGRVILQGTADWHTLKPNFPDFPGMRQIIVCDVDRVQTSCGYAVPKYEFVEERNTLPRYWTAKPEELEATHAEDNWCSIDGLPTHIAQQGES